MIRDTHTLETIEAFALRITQTFSYYIVHTKMYGKWNRRKKRALAISSMRDCKFKVYLFVKNTRLSVTGPIYYGAHIAHTRTVSVG